MEITDFLSLNTLNEHLKILSDTFDIVAVITKPDGSPISEYINFTDACEKYHRKTKSGLDRCIKSDAKLGQESLHNNNIIITHCWAGFVDIAVPIILEGKHVATVLTGQMSTKPLDLQFYKNLAKEIGIKDIDGYLEAIKKIKIISEKGIQRIANALAKYVELVFISAYEKYKNKELAEYYSNLVSSLPIPTNVFSLDFERLNVSKSTEQMFGYTLGELRDKSSFNKIYSEEDLKKMKEAFELAKQGQNSSVELMATRKDNTTFYMVVHFAPIKNKKSEIINIVATGTDISDIKNLQEYYQSVFYWLPLPATLNDLNSRRLEASIAVEKLYGYTIEELKGVKIEDIYDPKDKENIKNAIHKTLTEGITSEVEAQVIRKNGEKIPVLLNFSPVKNKNNEIINLIGTATDITDIKNREEEYKKVVEDTTVAAEYISSGNYSIRINTGYKQDDLKLLTETLNMVVEHLGKADEDLKSLIKELATPAIEVSKGVIVMPLIGKLTSDRALDAMDNILNKIEETKAKVGIIDITGVSNIDSAVADSLIKSVEAIKLIGAIPILSGISSTIAKNLVRMGIKFDFVTKSNLSEALEYAKEVAA